MKTFIFLLLAAIPTNLLLSKSTYPEIVGLWHDHYSGTKLEIKSFRKGVKVREVKRFWKKKWRKYYHMGRGVYDDCNGRYIVLLGRDRIKWQRSHYDKSIYLEKYDWNYRYEDPYRYNSKPEYPGLSRDSYYGDWYCSDHDLYLEIKPYGDGFRARRRGGEWTYYDEYNRNQYRDRRGNHYYFEEDHLYWKSKDGRRKFKFRRR